MVLKLRYKIFLVILLANALLITAIITLNTRAFNASFDAYLMDAQARRLAPLIEALADSYLETGNWSFVRSDTMRWQRLMRPYSFYRPEAQRPGPVLLLRDANGNLVLAPNRINSSYSWLAIERDGRLLGELGIPRNPRLISEFDQLFADQQRQQLLWIALVGLAFSALIAVPFASLLLKPITQLKEGTHRLTQGDYQLSLPIRGGDELASLAQDFNRLAQTLANNQDARQRWIADISHELRTPLAVLRAELEALLDGVRPCDGHTLQSLHQEVERLSGLVQDLHELSLSDAGALSYRMEPVNLTALINEVCAHFQASLEQQALKLQFNHPPEPVVIEGDQHRLTQMFTNLMHNSLNYTQSPGLIQIELKQSAEQVKLTWEDTAPGVPDESLSLLFDRLYRVEHSRSRQSGGSGLGLAIVHNVVTAHRGQVVAQHSSLGGLKLQIAFDRRKDDAADPYR